MIFIGVLLVSMGYCDEQAIVEALGVQLGNGAVDISRLKFPKTLFVKLHLTLPAFTNVIPIKEVDGALVVAMADPLNLPDFR